MLIHINYGRTMILIETILTIGKPIAFKGILHTEKNAKQNDYIINRMSMTCFFHYSMKDRMSRNEQHTKTVCCGLHII